MKAEHLGWRPGLEGLRGVAILMVMLLHFDATRDWFPEDTFFQYGSPEEAKEIIESTPVAEIERRAVAFQKHARENYLPEMILGEMVKRVGL